VLEGAQRHYVADDFLAAANGCDMPRSLPWLRSLVRDGLLAQPEKRGILGRRGGRALGTWPETQFKLFLILLDQMNKGVRSVAILCNVPVSLWLYFGSEYVPVCQVRRALTTYGAHHRTTSADRGRLTARSVARLLAGGPDMTRRDRDRLVEVVVTASRSGAFDRDSFIAAAGRIFDPDQRGRTMGPDRAPVSPEAWARMVEARLTALDRLDAIPEQAFEDARLAHSQGLAGYIQLQPEFARDREVGAMFQPITLNRLFNSACIDTVSILGLLELRESRA
jgi:hypothetical protein